MSTQDKPRNNGIKWSEEETILAFYYYCQIPFSKIGKGNPQIIELAELLERTPSSVGLKMSNLGHFDPELRARNVTGMEHTSKLDEEIVGRFFSDWEGLSEKAVEIENRLRGVAETLSYEEQTETILDESIEIPEGTVAETIARVRRNQNFFRKTVLTAYSEKCCITGITTPELLIASHIKPWKDSDPKTERTNPKNGLCLNALHDKAFDKGLMTITPDYKIHFSSRLKDIDNDGMRWMLKVAGDEISLPDKFCPSRELLEYHNDVVFRP